MYVAFLKNQMISLAHWAVLVEESDGFRALHVVGNSVISSGGIATTKINVDKYTTTKVGYLRESYDFHIRDKEKQSASQTCQDFSVFYAVAICESRYNTYLRCLFLPRFRIVMLIVSWVLLLIQVRIV